MERRIDIATPSGAMETFVVHPGEGESFPAVIARLTTRRCGDIVPDRKTI
jgi:hypothetical protein